MQHIWQNRGYFVIHKVMNIHETIVTWLKDGRVNSATVKLVGPVVLLLNDTNTKLYGNRFENQFA
jgi:hypothetical protein